MNMNSDDVNELEMSAESVRDLLNDGEKLTLVDVRKPVERDHVSLDDDLWIRMSEVPDNVDEIKEAETPVVIYCHHGMRSLKVAKHLRGEGLDDVYSLAGGIDYWAKKIDPDLPTY